MWWVVNWPSEACRVETRPEQGGCDVHGTGARGRWISGLLTNIWEGPETKLEILLGRIF